MFDYNLTTELNPHAGCLKVTIQLLVDKDHACFADRHQTTGNLIWINDNLARAKVVLSPVCLYSLCCLLEVISNAINFALLPQSAVFPSFNLNVGFSHAKQALINMFAVILKLSANQNCPLIPHIVHKKDTAFREHYRNSRVLLLFYFWHYLCKYSTQERFT